MALTDAPGRVEGAASSRLTLRGLSPADAASYTCQVTNACGTVGSQRATLGVCIADYDCNGGVDGDDVSGFFAAWESGTADVNGDGGVDGDDVSTFFALWESGGC